MAEMAVIKTGGKQYIVAAGKKLKIEKLPQEEGTDIEFSEVLLIQNDPSTSSGQATVKIGTPFLEGAKVKGKILKQGKEKKVVIFKFKAKKRERVKRGHRQPYSEVEITSIEAR